MARPGRAVAARNRCVGCCVTHARRSLAEAHTRFEQVLVEHERQPQHGRFAARRADAGDVERQLRVRARGAHENSDAPDRRRVAGVRVSARLHGADGPREPAALAGE